MEPAVAILTNRIARRHDQARNRDFTLDPCE
jgi:hypothetical protein